jgi:hypothetical protein
VPAEIVAPYQRALAEPERRGKHRRSHLPD